MLPDLDSELIAIYLKAEAPLTPRAARARLNERGVSPPDLFVVQAAIDRLLVEGLLQPTGRKGYYRAARPRPPRTPVAPPKRSV